MTRPRTRPPGWSKATVIELALNGAIMRPLKELAAPLGISWRTLHRDIYEWKKLDPDFAARYAAARADGDLPELSGGKRVKTATQENKTRYLEIFLKTGSLTKAADQAGISPDYAWRLRNPGGPLYDEAFHEAYTAAERRLYDRLHDVPVATALNPDVDPRTQAFVALKFLEVRDRARFGRKVEHQHSGSIQHSLGAPAVTKLIGTDFGEFYRGQLTDGAEPAEDIVEGEILAGD